LSRSWHKAAPVAGAGMGTAVTNEVMDYDPAFALAIQQPSDRNCSQCHAGTPTELFNAPTVLKSDIAKRGMSWDDPNNPDVHSQAGKNCRDCHGAGEDSGLGVTAAMHQFRKGNVMVGSSIRNDLDNELGFQSCEDCHDGAAEHATPTDGLHTSHRAMIHCSTCHIPQTNLFAVQAFDFLQGGKTAKFEGGNPTNPYGGGIRPTYLWWHEEKSGPFTWKIYPFHFVTSAIWNKGAADRDAFFLKEVKAAYDALVTAGTVTGDSWNTSAEIQAMVDRLTLNHPSAGTPVLWLSPEAFQLSHNISPNPESTALGHGGCADCHTPSSPFFSREVTLFPFAFENTSDPNIVMEFHGLKDGDGDPIPEIAGVNKTVPMWKLLGYSESRKNQLENMFSPAK
jgi:hypothetical protein